MIRLLSSLSVVAQATFLARYFKTLSPSLCRTAIKYAGMRLDHINSQLPEDNPYRQQYEERKRMLMQQQIGKFIPVQGVRPGRESDAWAMRRMFPTNKVYEKFTVEEPEKL